MPLVTLEDVSITYRGPPVLDGVVLEIDAGERVCLLGRNGEGKSTLLRLIQGELQSDRGLVLRGSGVRTSLVAQQVPRAWSGLVFDVVAEGLGERGRLVADYHHASHDLAEGETPARRRRLDELQRAIEAAGAWQTQQEVEEIVTRVGLDPEADVSTLSAGMKRRVLLAQALAARPDLLLLDEPTNHLDIAGIDWLEEFLLRWVGALLFVTHDRVFLKKLATRIIELDRGRLTSWQCDYDTFVARKQAALEAEAHSRALFDKRLAQEETWIRTGIMARRTRNEGRVRALEEMRRVRVARRERVGVAKVQLQEADRSGRLVIEAKQITHSFGDNTVVRGLSTLIMRGDRVGLIGPNGAGKTTLLRILLGQLAPQSGTIRHGTRLEIAYFDQLHAQLDEEASVIDNVGLGSESIAIEGRKRHVLGYLQDFLFTPEQARGPVKFLSGGERNRLLLARLFARPSNLLVMDEPTNDLDLETLELLEERLAEYSGTLLLVSHDREFLNNVVTSTLVFEGDGRVGEYAGGYDDWLRQRKTAAPSAATERPPEPKPSAASASARPAASGPARLKYAERKELEALPGRIEAIEAELAELHALMADASFYQGPRDQIVRTSDRVKSLDDELAAAYSRWEELEGRQTG